MITASWIAGLMAENTDALGFIPLPTIEHRYIRLGRAIGQHDERGHPVGYLLHGALRYGHPVTIAQQCIQYELRLRGYGEAVVQTLIERAEYAGAAAVRLRCATDLGALAFWRAQGFQVRDIVPGGQRRGRSIALLYRPLALPLLEPAP